MTTRQRATRTTAKKPKLEDEVKEGGEIVAFNVYSSADPITKGRAIRDELLGELPFSENYLHDAAHTWGGGRWYYFLPKLATGSFSKGGQSLYAPEIVTAPTDDEDEPLEISAEDDDGPERDVAAIVKHTVAAMSRHHQPAAQPASLGEMVTALKQLDELRGKHAQPEKNGAADLVGQLRQLEEVRRMFAPKEPNPRPIEPPATLSTQQALLQLITEDPLTLAAAREKLLGNDGESVSWLQMLPAIMPSVERIFASVAEAVRAARQPEAQAAMNAPAAAYPTPMNDSAPPAERADMQGFGRVLNQLLSALATNGEIEPVIELLDSFCLLFPEHAPLIESLMQQPPTAALEGLGQFVPQAAQLFTAPHAPAWIGRLQAAWAANDEPSDTGATGAQKGATT